MGGVNAALRKETRGLPRKITLSTLLHESGRKKNHLNTEDLSEGQILGWADEYHKVHGMYPKSKSGEIEDSLETWSAIENAIRRGKRGLKKEKGLSELLSRHNRIQGTIRKEKAPLTEDQILKWADEHCDANGQHPSSTSGKIDGSDETWSVINDALSRGGRGLPGNDSLAKLLARNDRKQHLHFKPNLTEQKILEWADAHYKATGEWPARKSGEIKNTGGEKWTAIQSALVVGGRGLPRKISLAKLLHESGRKENPGDSKDLSEDQILEWADAHYKATGEWPAGKSGEIKNTDGEKWANIEASLFSGGRGLPKGSSIARLLAKYRGTRNKKDLPSLTEDQILEWADLFYVKNNRYPTRQITEKIEDSDGETWSAVHSALAVGGRGLPRKTSLAKLLHESGRKKHRLRGSI